MFQQLNLTKGFLYLMTQMDGPISGSSAHLQAEFQQT